MPSISAQQDIYMYTQSSYEIRRQWGRLVKVSGTIVHFYEVILLGKNYNTINLFSSYEKLRDLILFNPSIKIIKLIALVFHFSQEPDFWWEWNLIPSFGCPWFILVLPKCIFTLSHFKWKFIANKTNHSPVSPTRLSQFFDLHHWCCFLWDPF